MASGQGPGGPVGVDAVAEEPAKLVVPDGDALDDPEADAEVGTEVDTAAEGEVRIGEGAVDVPNAAAGTPVALLSPLNSAPTTQMSNSTASVDPATANTRRRR
ncbi:MAG TPA: hypothetical protein VF444_15450 [Pseudonocardiaceae bacterium]